MGRPLEPEAPEPGLEHLRTPLLQLRGEATSLAPELAQIDAAGAGDLERVAHEPALQAARCRLDVELQPERMLPPGKGLIGVEPRGGQQLGFAREVESVAVPVQHRGARAQLGERGLAAGFGERERAPAQLLALASIDASAERLRHDLRAEAETEHGAAVPQAAFDGGDLSLEERIVPRLVDADRSAQNDQQIRIDEIAGAEIVQAGVAISDGEAEFAQHRGKAAEVLERDVPD